MYFIHASVMVNTQLSVPWFWSITSFTLTAAQGVCKYAGSYTRASVHTHTLLSFLWLFKTPNAILESSVLQESIKGPADVLTATQAHFLYLSALSPRKEAQSLTDFICN